MNTAARACTGSTARIFNIQYMSSHRGTSRVPGTGVPGTSTGTAVPWLHGWYSILIPVPMLPGARVSCTCPLAHKYAVLIYKSTMAPRATVLL
jgi:hypothetical protein